MPFTPQQEDAINAILVQLEEKITDLIKAREDCYAIMRVDDDIQNAECMAVVLHAKARGKTAADAISLLLT